jgi:hypothetical protein
MILLFAACDQTKASHVVTTVQVDGSVPHAEGVSDFLVQGDVNGDGADDFLLADPAPDEAEHGIVAAVLTPISGSGLFDADEVPDVIVADAQDTWIVSGARLRE